MCTRAEDPPGGVYDGLRRMVRQENDTRPNFSNTKKKRNLFPTKPGERKNKIYEKDGTL